MFNRLLTSVILLMFAVSGWCVAQDINTDIYLEQDIELSDGLIKVEKMIQKKDYASAFNGLITIIKQAKNPSACAQDPTDNELFFGISERARKLLFQLPSECKATAIKEHDVLAENCLNNYARTGEVEQLIKILNEAFLSSKTEEAVALLAEIYLERGDARRSLVTLNNYLNQRNLQPDNKISSLLFISRAMSNQYDSTLEKQIREGSKEQKIRWQGREMSGGELADSVRAQFMKAEVNEKVFGAKLNPKWSVKIPNLNVVIGPTPSMSSLRGFASVYGDSVFINAGTLVKRFNLKTGEPVGKDYTLVENVLYQSFSYPLSVKSCLTINGTLYANLITGTGRQEVQKSPMPFATTEFAAFNIKDGKILWTISSANASNQEFIKIYAGAMVNSPPTYYNGKIILEMLSLRTSSDEFLLVLDATTGKMEWNTFICAMSKNVKVKGGHGGMGARSRSVSMPILRAARSVLCLDNDVYFSTAYGAMGNMNLLNGNLVWIRKFNPLQLEMTRSMSTIGSPRPQGMIPGKTDLGWLANQPLNLNDNTVIFTPQRCSDVNFLKRSDGQKNVDKLSYDRSSRQVLGLVGNKLYLYDEMVTEVDTDAKNAAVNWGFYGATNGQGAIANGCVFLPLGNCIAVLSLDKKRIINLTKLKDNFQSGNLIVHENLLLGCAPDRLSVFEIVPDEKPTIDVPYAKFVPVPGNAPKQNHFAELIHQLGSPDSALQKKSYQELIRWCPETFDVLLKARLHNNLEISLLSMNILKKAKYTPEDIIIERFVEYFPQTITDDDEIQNNAINNILDLGLGVVPYLEKQLSPAIQPEANKRYLAAICLERFDPTPVLAIPALLQTMKSDPNNEMRTAAFKAIKTITEVPFDIKETEKIEAFIKEKQLIPTIEGK